MTISGAFEKFMLGLRGGEANWTLRAGFFLLGVVAIAIMMVVVHNAAGLTLPAPWGDEAYFIYQGRAFERWNSFIAPELDPTRPVLLLPYGYPMLLGIVFKMFGYSLETARAVSLVATMGGFVLLASTVRQRKTMLVGLVLVGAFMLNGPFVAMANNARMEAVVFLCVCGALYLMQVRANWASVGLLAAAAMIHPNTVLMAMPVVLYALFARQIWRTWPSRTGWIMLGLALAAWLAQGLYVLANWSGFEYDLAYRFAETSNANKGPSQYGGWHAIGLFLILATGLLATRRKIPVGHLIAFAVGAWLMNRMRVEQWYEVFGDLAYLLLALCLIEIIAVEVRARLPGFRFAPAAAAIAVAGLGSIVFLKSGHLDGPKGYFQDLNVNGMVFADEVPYFTHEDRMAIQAYIDAQPHAGDPMTVEYYPWGDALLFPDAEPDTLRFQMSYFDPDYLPSDGNWRWGYGPTPLPTPDLYILRKSKYQPRWLDDRFEKLLARAIERSGGQEPQMVRSRDGTEIWYAVPTRQKSRSTKTPSRTDAP